MGEALTGGDAAALLAALQLGDSFFPAGRYTLSHGLESFAEAGLIGDVEDLEALLRDYVANAVGRSDAVAVATANRAATSGDIDTITDVDQLLLAMKLSAEASMSSVRTGRQVLLTASRLIAAPVLDSYARQVTALAAPGNHAVVFGILSAAYGLNALEAATVDLHAYATSLLGAALRLVRIDHYDAQVALRHIQSLVMETAQAAVETDYRDMSAFAPVIEIMQMQHEVSNMRLFAS